MIGIREGEREREKEREGEKKRERESKSFRTAAWHRPEEKENLEAKESGKNLDVKEDLLRLRRRSTGSTTLGVA